MVERLKTLMIAALLAALAGSIALAATGGEAEVRINARQLEDGRVEFALQQRVDGEWGERQLPSSRYFPADAGHNRWLNSTPLTVSVASADELNGEPTGPTPQAETSPAGIRTQVGDGVTPGGALWSVSLDDFTDDRLVFVASPSDSNSSIYTPKVVLYCRDNGTRLFALLSGLPVSDIRDRYSATVRWDHYTAQDTSWSESSSGVALLPAQLYRSNITNHDTLRIRVRGYSTTVTATLDVAEMRKAPTWPNILACGS